MKNLEKLRIYVRASLYCYLDHGERYENWKKSKYKSLFDPLFQQLVKPPIILYVKNDKHLYIVVLETKKELMIVFPGTRKTLQGLKDFQLDFSMMPRKTNNFEAKEEIFIHDGFLYRYDCLRETTQKYLSTCSRCKKITLLGHSLGAAMAVMTAFDVKTRKLRLNTKCVTFGMPKFSCENFYKIYANSNIGILSVKKDHDPICHPVFMPTFKYLGSELTVAGNDSIWMRILCGTSALIFTLKLPWILHCFLAIVISLYGLKLTHSTSTYVDRIDSYLASNSRKRTYSTSLNSEGTIFERTKTCLQDLALLLPIIIILSISLLQYIILSLNNRLSRTANFFINSCLPNLLEK